MPRIVVSLLLFITATGFVAAEEKSEKLVGSWRLVKSDDKVPGRVIIAFNSNGIAVIQVMEVNRKPESNKGIWRVDATALLVRDLSERNGHTERMRIVRLTDSSLLVQDSDGKRMEFVRLK